MARGNIDWYKLTNLHVQPLSLTERLDAYIKAKQDWSVVGSNAITNNGTAMGFCHYFKKVLGIDFLIQLPELWEQGDDSRVFIGAYHYTTGGRCLAGRNERRESIDRAIELTENKIKRYYGKKK